MEIKDIANDPARLQVFDKFLEETCRQWCDFIGDEPERATGEGFAEFFYGIFEMKSANKKSRGNLQESEKECGDRKRHNKRATTEAPAWKDM